MSDCTAARHFDPHTIVSLSQSSIQRELAVKGYSTESDPVMAEYITIMLINSKTPEAITAELIDLIGTDYDPAFTDWLFAEASVGEDESGETNVLVPTEATSSAPVAAPSAS